MRDILLVVIIVFGVTAGVFGVLLLRKRPVPVSPVAIEVDPKQQEAELVAQLQAKAKMLPPAPTPTPALAPSPSLSPAPTPTPAPVMQEAPPPPPPVTKPPPPPRDPPKLVLQGIMRGGRYDEALINGYSYRVGDEIEGAKVTAIEAGAVRLVFDGRELTLRLR